jgi:fructose-specific phosphotransferase system IIC component
MVEELKKLRQHLLTGVSFAIPFIACGGILIALAIAIVPIKEATLTDKGGPDWSHASQFVLLSKQVGEAAFGLMLPILAGYIAYSIAGKPGLVAGCIGGFLAGEIKAGFLGAVVVGLVAGYLVQGLKRIPTHKFVKPIMPILIIPIVSSLIVGTLMLFVLGPPIASALDGLGHWLEDMKTGNAMVLAMLLGAMIAFDMGGPVNKAAFFFASGLIAQGNIWMMGPVAAAICTPPLGMGLATIIGRKLWSTEQQESGYAALGMGTIGITEGAIPFAAGDPLRVIPSIMLGSMTASTIAMLGHCGDHAPHGGLIVLPVVDNRLMYVLAIIVGTVVTAVCVNTLKKVWKAPGEAVAS